MKKLLVAALLFAACSNASPDSKPTPDETPRTYRVMAGVSMGGYGAGYLGTRYHDKFDLVGVMGGPLDWTFLAWYIQTNLMGGFYDEPGLDYSYEDWFEGIDDNFERDEYIELMEDLALTWGIRFRTTPRAPFTRQVSTPTTPRK